MSFIPARSTSWYARKKRAPPSANASFKTCSSAGSLDSMPAVSNVSRRSASIMNAVGGIVAST